MDGPAPQSLPGRGRHDEDEDEHEEPLARRGARGHRRGRRRLQQLRRRRGHDPTRTINGSYTETFLDGTSGTVTLAGVVRPPRNVCRWPTGGTLTRALAGGTTHVLAFGPTCGAATLDGTAVTLPARQGPHGDGSGHHGPGGGMHGGRR